MNTETLGIIAMFIITLLMAIPLGRYIAKVFSGERTIGDKVFNPIERIIYKFRGINSNAEWSWQKNLVALLTINLVWFLLAMFILTNMEWLPLNPDQNPSQSPHLPSIRRSLF